MMNFILNLKQMIFVKIIESELNLKVEKEFKFCPTRKFKADYYIPELKLLIEKEGGVYTGRAHGSITGILRDMEKYNIATILGYRILRYTPQQLTTIQPIKDIWMIINL